MGDAERVDIPVLVGASWWFWASKVGALIALALYISFLLVDHRHPSALITPTLAVVLVGTLVGLTFAVAYNRPKKQRHISFVGDQLQIRDGAGQMLLDVPAAEADVDVGHYVALDSIDNCPVIRIRGGELGELTLFCTELFHRYRDRIGKRYWFPRLVVAQPVWKQLVAHLGVECRA